MTRFSVSARLALALGLVAALGGAATARADWVWKAQTGWVDPNLPPRDTPRLRYEHALVLLTQGHGRSAVNELEALLKEVPKAEWIEEAFFNIGEAYYQAAQYKRAARAFEDYLGNYPAGEFAEEALKRLLMLGVALSERWGNLDKAVDVLEKVIELAPASDLAVDATAAIGDAYFRAGHYDEAADAFQDLAMRFPRSEWVEAVPFKVGRCYMRKAAQLDVNPEAYAMAQEHFEQYVKKYPDGVRVAEAKRYIREAKALQARSEYRLAEFYMRIKKPRSAAIYLKTVRDKFPDTDSAMQADNLLKRLDSLGMTR